MELIWTDCAKESLKDIALYIEYHFTPLLAQKIFDRIHGEVQILRHSPRIGRVVSCLAKYGEIRCLTIHHNNVYYLLDGDKIEVVAVWDYRRSQEELLDRILDFFNKIDEQ